jgi:hypothetical protein
MPIRTELSLRLPNTPGALATLCASLAAERVTILALGLESHGSLRLVVDNHVRALDVLRAEHHQVTTREVVALSVANGPGGLAAVARIIADAGVNIEYAYGGASERSADAVMVLGVGDAQRAAAASGV